jgi:hypothetical protein
MNTKAKKPPDTPEAPQATIDHINTLLNKVKDILDDYSKYILTIDHGWLNEAEDNKSSLLGQAYELALKNNEFLPHYLTLERFGTDIQYLTDFRNLLDLTSHIQEKLWNITIQSAGLVRKDAITNSK